jgi:hypothetical protein
MSVSLSSGGGGGGSPASDCGTGGDAGNSFSAASGLTLPVSSCSGALPGGDTQDWYQFYAASGASLSVSMTPNSGADFDLCVYDPSGSTSWCSGAGTGATDAVSLTTPSAGSWRAMVYVYAGSGSYTFSASASAGSTSGDCGTAGDAGNSFGSATGITLPKSCTGTLGTGGDSQDWYSFYKPSGASLSVSMTPNPSADFDLCLYDPSGTAVACSTAGTGSTDSISGTTGMSGYWRAVVYVYAGSGSYSLSVS